MGLGIGFILASAGSAIGLGAIWKFPFWAGANGGGNFIIPASSSPLRSVLLSDG